MSNILIEELFASLEIIIRAFFFYPSIPNQGSGDVVAVAAANLLAENILIPIAYALVVPCDCRDCARVVFAWPQLLHRAFGI